MSFIEPWSNAKSSTRPFMSPVEPSDDEADLYPEIGQTPSITLYEPVTLEELSEDPDDEAFIGRSQSLPAADLDEISWKQLDNEIVLWIDAFIREPWMQEVNDDWEHPPGVTSNENAEHLFALREFVLQLGAFVEVREFCAWLSEAIDRLEVLKLQQKTPLHRISSKSNREKINHEIEQLQQEIDAFEEEWGIREQIARYEELVLQTYLERMAAAQTEIVQRRADGNGIGKFGPKPYPRAIKSSYDFEHYCCSWMVYLGAEDAEVSKASGDGGVDIHSENYVAQVKLYNGPIPVSQIRDLLGTAIDFDRKPLFFASMAYSKGSLEFADRNGIALFLVDSYRGEISAANDAATESITHGLHG
jgi:hypothetical protein